MRILLISLLISIGTAILGQDTESDTEANLVFCKTNASESKGVLQIQIELPENNLNSNSELFLETDAGTFPSKNKIFKVPLSKLLEGRRKNLVVSFWLVTVGTDICRVTLDLNNVKSKLISDHLKSIGSKKISLRDFDYISSGMDIEEVISYFGHTGEEILRSESVIEGAGDYAVFGRAWKNSDGSQLIVLFMQNRVYFKSHVGLKY
ncbi:hypothetical protein [Leptospira interrogans]|uniref:hypothetical protein n=1 Tax=Leptospira interrogans TaxID=173 RepID=UPI00034BE8D5|nr:hypothetical protein [Leptospira interrogans]